MSANLTERTERVTIGMNESDLIAVIEQALRDHQQEKGVANCLCGFSFGGLKHRARAIARAIKQAARKPRKATT